MDQSNLSEIIKKTLPIESNTGVPERLDIKPGAEEREAPPLPRQSSEVLEAKLQRQIQDIEAGKAAPVDQAILNQARQVISHETGGVNNPKANLQHLLDMLHGNIDEPSGALEEVLKASEDNQKNSNLN